MATKADALLLELTGTFPHPEELWEGPEQEDVQAGLDSGAAGEWVHAASPRQAQRIPSGPTH